ncbi:MAG: DUF1667 domain-containing protein [Ruminococcaceae bacterium]|nr:DUF1667 domain-containing protein [Oscillospiraceae bacterium]
MKKLTCIVCPLGCEISVYGEKDNFNVTGNGCIRGKEYAIGEMTNPVRCVTTSAKCDNGKIVSVKTQNPIPKQNCKECVEFINKVTVKTPVKIGDIILENVFGTNIIATKNIQGE